MEECRKFGPDSAAEFLDALEHGDDSEQYGALGCLRQLGYEVWGVGYDSELYYTVLSPDGEEDEIVPDQR